MSNQGNEQTNATWGGRFNEGPSDLMLRFSESVSFETRLARFDIQGSRAHASMLAHCGLISQDDFQAIDAGLVQVLREIESGNFQWHIQLEDVHMNIEQALTRNVPAAAKLHTGRSRNDQIATDMRLYAKAACKDLQKLLSAAMTTMVNLAESAQAIYIPGYTHLQRAQPVSAAHHLLAYVEMLWRDHQRLANVYDSANWCPLGCGALAGSTLPIDREFTARKLGFVDANGYPRVTRNSMDTVADRDYMIEFASATALCGVHLSRLAEDIILWNSAEFNFIRLPDTFTTGSSIMPQKKNPDCMELLRGKAARLNGNLFTLISMVKNLPLTYNRDLQEDKPALFDSCDTLAISLQVVSGALQDARFNEEACARAVSDPLLLATDLADYLVEQGVPFREAHHLVGKCVALAEKRGVPLDSLPDADVISLDERFGSGWRDVFNLDRSMARREQPGMSGSEQVRKEIAGWRSRLEGTRI